MNTNSLRHVALPVGFVIALVGWAFTLGAFTPRIKALESQTAIVQSVAIQQAVLAEQVSELDRKMAQLQAIVIETRNAVLSNRRGP